MGLPIGRWDDFRQDAGPSNSSEEAVATTSEHELPGSTAPSTSSNRDQPRALIIAIASENTSSASQDETEDAVDRERQRNMQLERGLEALNVLLQRVRDRQTGLSRTLEDVRASVMNGTTTSSVGPTWLESGDTSTSDQQQSTSQPRDIVAAVILPSLSRQDADSTQSPRPADDRTPEQAQAFLRSTEVALRNATAFAQRLEDVTRSLSSLANRSRLRISTGIASHEAAAAAQADSSIQTSTSASQGPRQRRLSEVTGTSSPRPFLNEGTAALSQSINDLRTASARIDRVFEELELSRQAADRAISSATDALNQISVPSATSSTPRDGEIANGSAPSMAPSTESTSLPSMPDRRMPPWRRANIHHALPPLFASASASQASPRPIAPRQPEGHSRSHAGRNTAIASSTAVATTSSSNLRTGRLNVKLDRNGDPDHQAHRKVEAKVFCGR